MENLQKDKVKKKEQLRRLEEEMNQVFADIEDLEAREAAGVNKPVVDLEDEGTDSEEFADEEVEEEEQLEKNSIGEVESILGVNPNEKAPRPIILRADVLQRLKAWTTAGLTEKGEKNDLLASIPRKGDDINLEGPTLNDEMQVDLFPKSVKRDEYFKEYQNLVGASLSTTASVLCAILNDGEKPLDRDEILKNLGSAVKLQSHLFYALTVARKSFLIGRYDEKIQKLLKKAEPTSLLFGDDLKGIIESSKTMEKVAKDLKPKTMSFQTSQKRGLNWKGSPGAKETGRGSQYKSHQSKTSGLRAPNTTSSRERYPGKRFYNQSQPPRHGKH